MSFDLIIQARYKSSRLPAKIFLNFDDENFLTFFIKNIQKLKQIRKIIIASPNDEFSKIFKFLCKKLKIDLFLKNGDEKNVLKRFYYCAKKFSSKNIVRITSDCPFINPLIVSKMLKHYKKNKLDFLTNNKPRRIPHGFDCEIISFRLLKKTYQFANNNYDKEHVTPWIYKNVFQKKNQLQIFDKNFSKIRLTLDTSDDYINFIKKKEILKKIATKKKIEIFLKKYK